MPDFINEIVNKNSAFGVHNAQRIKDDKTMQKANKLIAWARANNIQIAYVHVSFRKDIINNVLKFHLCLN
ncbi:hypothetical protein [Francisella-like endosymbiont]|uniref:hypothetical protein n=1 Tax=Francisella-like endosymbiont TaxID=512373 RepID=UPI003CD0224A